MDTESSSTHRSLAARAGGNLLDSIDETAAQARWGGVRYDEDEEDEELDGEDVPDQALLPKPRDPKLWSIKTKVCVLSSSAAFAMH